MPKIDPKKPFSVQGVMFETQTEAQDYAKILVKKWEVDVAVMKMDSIVKFPIPDYEVVSVG